MSTKYTHRLESHRIKIAIDASHVSNAIFLGNCLCNSVIGIESMMLFMQNKNALFTIYSGFHKISRRTRGRKEET
jgi:hypothetical protein